MRSCRQSMVSDTECVSSALGASLPQRSKSSLTRRSPEEGGCLNPQAPWTTTPQQSFTGRRLLSTGLCRASYSVRANPLSAAPAEPALQRRDVPAVASRGRPWPPCLPADVAFPPSLQFPRTGPLEMRRSPWRPDAMRPQTSSPFSSRSATILRNVVEELPI